MQLSAKALSTIPGNAINQPINKMIHFPGGEKCCSPWAAVLLWRSQPGKRAQFWGAGPEGVLRAPSGCSISTLIMVRRASATVARLYASCSWLHRCAVKIPRQVDAVWLRTSRQKGGKRKQSPTIPPYGKCQHSSGAREPDCGASCLGHQTVKVGAQERETSSTTGKRSCPLSSSGSGRPLSQASVSSPFPYPGAISSLSLTPTKV